MIDRHGNCPNCKTNWDGGDILESLQRMDVHAVSALSNKSDMVKLASEYGWTPDNKKRFSLVSIHEIPPYVYFVCPKCLATFDSNTGQQFNSIYEARERDKQPESANDAGTPGKTRGDLE